MSRILLSSTAVVFFFVLIGATEAASCFGMPKLCQEADALWQGDDEVRAWFQENHNLASQLAEMTDDQMWMFKRVQPPADKFMTDRVKKMEIPEQVQDSANHLKLQDWQFWLLFTTIYREHAQWILPPRYERHDAAKMGRP